MGDYTRHTVDGPAVTVVADTSALRFVAYAPDVVRIELPSLATRIDSSLVVDRPAPAQRLLSISDGASEPTLSTSALTIRVEKTPVCVCVEDASGRVLLAEPDAVGVSAMGSAASDPDADLGALSGGTYFLRMTATRFGRQLFTDTEKLTIVR